MLIGFVGRRRAGKDTAAAVLAAEGFRVVKFAFGIKVMLSALLRSLDASDLNIERMVEGDLKETPTAMLGGKSPRFFMQHLGTEFGRNLIGENFWVDTALAECSKYKNSVIADCRFPNEAEAVRKAGGILIRASRVQTYRDTHPSEALVDDIDVDYVLSNNGTIDAFGEKVKHLVNRLRREGK